MICEHCQHQLPPKYESYHDFSLNLTSSPSSSSTLQSLLDHFFADEYTDNFSCSKCQCPKEQNRVKLCKSITNLAPIVILQLKRFQYNPMKQELTKIEQEIDFQTEVSFKPYCKEVASSTTSSNLNDKYMGLWSMGVSEIMVQHNEKYPKRTLVQQKQQAKLYEAELVELEKAQRKKTFFSAPVSKATVTSGEKREPTVTTKIGSWLAYYASTTSQENSQLTSDRTAEYQLSGVIRHFGSQLYRGHYIADVKSTTINYDNGSWIRYNDSIANPIDVVSRCHYLPF
jgi:uncharacterized UBP type Zn finger protein